MAKRQEETGRERQTRIQREQHRPEQNAGYDEAVRGGPGSAPVKLDVMDITTDKPASRDERRFDRAARDAENDVRRRERSAD